MTIPDFQSIMLPFMKIVRDQETHNMQNTESELALFFNLTEEEVNLKISSGSRKFYNRVGWAKTHLKKAGLIEYPTRGSFRITPRGNEVLELNPPMIDTHLLMQFPEYEEFRQKTERGQEAIDPQGNFDEITPDEALDKAYQSLRADLADDLLDMVLQSSPEFFEKMVVELLVAMGYGGTQMDAARAVGGVGDEGIDGIIDEDRLGLDSIYLQAKKWNRDARIGRPQIQAFVGALFGKRAKKGVLITTSDFTNDARIYSEGIDTKVVLINGERLANLMIDFGIGVTTKKKFEIKDIDSDYFLESGG